jgi:hypothetical protein
MSSAYLMELKENGPKGLRISYSSDNITIYTIKNKSKMWKYIILILLIILFLGICIILIYRQFYK